MDKSITHVSFDLWDTLIQSNPLYRNERNKLFSKIFKIFVLPEEFKKRKGLIDKINELTGIQMSYEQMIALLIGDSIKDDEKSNFKRQCDLFRSENEKLVLKYPPKVKEGILEILQSLSARGITMSILSNTNFIEGNVITKVLRSYDIHKYFSFIDYSNELVLAKPNPNAYRTMLHRVGKSSSKVVHIGDNAYSDSGAGVVKSVIVNNVNDIKNYIDEETDILLS